MYKLAFGINRQQTLFHSTLKKISPPYYTLWLSHSVFFSFVKKETIVSTTEAMANLKTLCERCFACSYASLTPVVAFET